MQQLFWKGTCSFNAGQQLFWKGTCSFDARQQVFGRAPVQSMLGSIGSFVQDHSQDAISLGFGSDHDKVDRQRHFLR
jgi:hypothetical protein